MFLPPDAIYILVSSGDFNSNDSSSPHHHCKSKENDHLCAAILIIQIQMNNCFGKEIKIEEKPKTSKKENKRKRRGEKAENRIIIIFIVIKLWTDCISMVL